ncbi:MAG: endonuclease/exonuclease/phosphatase family protein [Syntrophales bacterium]|nr:endonuclease/exonuclease/phosphatase family protein [Syntrophales bacterium]
MPIVRAFAFPCYHVYFIKMKGLKFAKRAIKPIVRPLNWLRAFNPRRRASNVPLDTVSAEPPAAGLNLKVMSFNIRRGTAKDGRNSWPFRRHLVREVLTRYRPDVLGLQEALDFQIAEIHAMLPGYAVSCLENPDGRILHNAIFYNAARFALSEEGLFWFSETPDVPGSKGWGNIMARTCAWVRLTDKGSEQSFYFYNTHLDHLSSRSRKKSVVLLMQRIHGRSHPEAFILTGDFNAREKSAPIMYLKGKTFLNLRREGKVLNSDPLKDAFRVRHPNLRNVATFHGYHRFFFRFKLDYTFVSPSVRVLDARIIQLCIKKCYPSDHFPLFTRIDVPLDVDK